MERRYDYDTKSNRGGFWSFIGYLSFGILGLFLGAAIVYGLFSFYLTPVVDEETIPEPDPVEEKDVTEEAPLPFPEKFSDIPGVVEQVMPSVVGVSSRIDIDIFEDQDVSLEQTESASGLIISHDGYIITNQHVIAEAAEIKVVIPDQGLYLAEVIGSDAMTDLALLRIEASGLDYVSFADSEKSRVGETVLAIGNPLGLQQTVTAGIISALERQVRIPGTEYAYTFVQTDAVVNPGNSGGPLVNLEGEVVGINTAKIALAGIEGIGFSVPSNTVERVIIDLKEYGRVLRPHMGVLIEDWLDYDEPEPDMGVHLVEVAPGSPADEAGLRDGDIIVAIDDQRIDYIAQLFDQMLAYYPDDTATITFFRNGEERETTLTFDERPDEMPEDPFIPEDPEEDEEDIEE